MDKNRKLQLIKLQKKLGLSQMDLELLDCALIHPSYAMEANLHKDNQRLEFLGDAVIDLIMGEYLFNKFPKDDEGKLTIMRASLVCEASLASAAKRLKLNEYILLGKGESGSGGALRPSNLADAWEAVCGAIYLSCGLEAIKPMIETYLDHEIHMVTEGYYGDYKTRLQEFIQKEQGHLIQYRLVEEKGPAHNPLFNIEVLVDDNTLGNGWGKSKKLAEREAAKNALIFLGELPALSSKE